MKLNDTCPCGAKFNARGLFAESVARMWLAWINAHRQCRGPQAAWLEEDK